MRNAACLVLLCALSTAHAKPAADEHRRFHDFLDAEWEWTMHEFPTWATAVGDPRYDDRLDDSSFAAFDRRKAHVRDVVTRLEHLDRAKLTSAEQLDYDLYLRDARLDVEGQRFPSELLVLDQMGGAHSLLADLAQNIPRRNAADLDHFLARMDAYPKYVDQQIAVL
ncbi:MAG TPA: DUF885 family protein, partial [Polyangia bacterium]